MDNIYSAYHYACKTKADKEAVEQIYEEVKKSAQNAIFRNIGDIFFTARTDTEINGAVECNGGTYSTADFEGKQNVGNLLANGSLPYVSLSEYANLVSANGSCRAFGWDNGDTFRVPTIPALLLTKEQSAVVGNGMTLGLTDGTSNAGIRNETGYYMAIDTSVYGNTIGTAGTGAYVNTNKSVGVTTDPTKSGIVANLDVIEYRAMVQLASGATDQAVITATSALQQVANKANRDLSNVDGADFVIESYEDGASFYRLYKSGFCEQGGSELTAVNNKEIYLLKPYKDDTYKVLTTGRSTACRAVNVSTRTNEMFKVIPRNYTDASSATTYDWMTFGYIY